MSAWDGVAHVVVAIDGPAGSGKSTVAREVARALGIAHLDTGAMYRAVTARALASDTPLGDGDALERLAGGLDLDFTPEGLLVDGRLAGAELRTPGVDAAVSEVSAHGGVRAALVRHQRRIMEHGGIVAEGRDIGTVVYPEAPVKVFLTASIEELARRRLADRAGDGHDVSIEALAEEIRRRDFMDSTREHSPLEPATDAVTIDTTAMTLDQVVAEVVRLARQVARAPEQP